MSKQTLEHGGKLSVYADVKFFTGSVLFGAYTTFLSKAFTLTDKLEIRTPSIEIPQIFKDCAYYFVAGVLTNSIQWWTLSELVSEVAKFVKSVKLKCVLIDGNRTYVEHANINKADSQGVEFSETTGVSNLDRMYIIANITPLFITAKGTTFADFSLTKRELAGKQSVILGHFGGEPGQRKHLGPDPRSEETKQCFFRRAECCSREWCPHFFEYTEQRRCSYFLNSSTGIHARGMWAYCKLNNDTEKLGAECIVVLKKHMLI